MPEATLVLTRRLAAPVSDVFEAWTRPDLMQQWFAPEGMTAREVDCDPRPGGVFRVAMLAPDGERFVTSGTYSEVVPNRKLVHSWKWESSDTVTRVTLEFRPDGDRHTEFTLTHELFPDEAMRERHREGWEGCLARLDGYIETASSRMDAREAQA